MSEQTVTWESPSNIAIVKYWGKKGFQIPANPSVSFTLDKCKTVTSITLEARKKTSNNISFEYFFENKQIDSFNKKIEQYLHKITSFIPLLNQQHFVIHSHNTFPHSTGVASSASSMSALALCLLDLQYSTREQTLTEQDFTRQASHLSRMGSGSACRSLYPHVSLWGRCPHGHDTYAVPVTDIHEIFKTYQNSVLIVSDREKTIPSRIGHSSMENHPYKEQRYKLAKKRVKQTLACLKEGNETALGNILEQESLELHALAATATPSFLYMEPNALQIIKDIRQFRQDTRTPLYFSLDAGTNIHLLHPKHSAPSVGTFIDTQLKPLLKPPYVIQDQVGKGPRKIL